MAKNNFSVDNSETVLDKSATRLIFDGWGLESMHGR